jgi:hypothetical protein
VKRLALLLAAALVLIGVAQSSTTASPTPAPALVDLNRWRAEAHEPRVLQFTAAYNSACAAHDHYMKLLGRLTHPEQPGRPGYTPAGADAGPNSVLAEPDGLPKATWVDSVYHRMGVLQPRLRISGFAAAEGFACLRTGGPAVDDSAKARTAKLTLYPWPPNGATGHPLTFGHAADETPSPLIDAHGPTSLGLLLSVNVNGPWTNHAAPQSKVSHASLVSASGASVALAITDKSTANGGYTSGGFVLLPLKALEPGTTYTAHAAGTVTAFGVSYPFNLAWHFSTKAACTTPQIVAPNSVVVPASLKFSFPISLTCNGDTLAGKQIVASVVQNGQEHPLPAISTYELPATMTVSLGQRGASSVILRFAGGDGLAAASRTIALSYS